MKASSEKIKRFIQQVSCPQLPNTFNPWSSHCELDTLRNSEAPEARRERLRAHLSGENIRLILIGEAPGYQGCRYSGIPFTSEKLLMNGSIPRIERLMRRITHRHIPFSEPAATIVWKALYEKELAEHTILWNAFPWHPMKPGEKLSNRTPSPKEIEYGLDILKAMLALFPRALVAAVGRQAEKAMFMLGRKPDFVLRHPSNGGAGEFRIGLNVIAKHLVLAGQR